MCIRDRVRVDQVAAEKPARGIFGVMPAGLALNALTAAAASETDLSQARIEAEAIDSASGARIGAFVDPEPARHGTGERTWDALQEGFDFYAGRLRTRFDREHGG